MEPYEARQRLHHAEAMLFTVALNILAAKGNHWSLDELFDDQLCDGIIDYFKRTEQKEDT